MLPSIALVGRPNVGKSTLFNFLTRSRDALVADYPGLTRDRQYGFGKRGDKPYLVIDTGGLSGESDIIDDQIAEQANKAMEEADAILFMVDARDGLTGFDHAITKRLRQAKKPIHLVVNKAEGMDKDIVASDFFALGLGQPQCVSAAHGDGITQLVSEVLEALPDASEEELDEHYPGIRVAVIGRPNAGKSTLVNRILGEERVVASEVAGTTRDSIFVPFERDDKEYTLIDTAGIRRRAKVDLAVEKFSIAKAMQAIDTAHVVIAVLDAHTEIAEQDARLIGMVIERGRALVLAVNKWDGLEQDEREWIKQQLEVKLPFAKFANLHFISALHGTGVGDLFKSIQSAYTAAMVKMSTSDLTRHLETAVFSHQPPAVAGRRIKLRYAHQGGSNPPLIIVHGNQLNRLSDTYRRYLSNYFREVYKLYGTPVRFEFRTGDNPFHGRKNKVKTERQENKARRTRRFIRDAKKSRRR